MKNSPSGNQPTMARPGVFFGLTLLSTWVFWGIALVSGATLESGMGIVWLALGVLGPLVMGVGLTLLTRNGYGRRDYWRRMFNVRQIPTVWWAIVILFVPVLLGVSALLDWLLGGSGAAWEETVRNGLANPLGLMPPLIFATIIPFIEELGWRGYVQDRLQERWSLLNASLIVGGVWALWHLPLFFIPGTYQAGLGIGTLAFWLFFLATVSLSVVIGWIYNSTGRSILAAIVFHALVNFFGELIALSTRAETISTALWLVAAVVLALVWGNKHMVRAGTPLPA